MLGELQGIADHNLEVIRRHIYHHHDSILLWQALKTDLIVDEESELRSLRSRLTADVLIRELDVRIPNALRPLSRRVAVVVLDEIPVLDFFVVRMLLLVANSAQKVLPPGRWHLAGGRLLPRLPARVRVDPAILRESPEHVAYRAAVHPRRLLRAVRVDDRLVELFEAGTLGFLWVCDCVSKRSLPAIAPIEMGQVERAPVEPLLCFRIREGGPATPGRKGPPRRRRRIVIGLPRDEHRTTRLHPPHVGRSLAGGIRLDHERPRKQCGGRNALRRRGEFDVAYERRVYASSKGLVGLGSGSGFGEGLAGR